MPRKLDYVPVDKVIPADQNAKEHTPEIIQDSMNRFGYTSPLILDERSGRLIAGHGRLEALQALKANGQPAPEGIEVTYSGEWTVPVVRGWASKNDDEALAVLIADNRLVEAGGMTKPF